MIDICAKGGISAVETFAEKHPNRILGINLEQHVMEEYIQLLEDIIIECPYHVKSIEDAYYASRILKVYYYSKDATTHKSCWLQLGVIPNTLDRTFEANFNKKAGSFKTKLYEKPYSEWDAKSCESSCVAELDTIYREYAKITNCDTSDPENSPKKFNEFRKACEIFKNTGNPTCGNINFAQLYETSDISSRITTITEYKNDICAESGVKALKEYEYYTSYVANKSPKAATNKVNDEIAQDIIAFSKRIMKECPDHSKYVDDEHFRLRIELVYAQSIDSVTGKQCKDVLGVTYSKENGLHRTELPLFHKPYSEWEPKQCESSCVAELDAIYREFVKSPACVVSEDDYLPSNTYDYRKTCELFKTTDNKICGHKNFEKMYKEKGGIICNDNTCSDATTFMTSPIALFALILCLLFTYLNK